MTAPRRPRRTYPPLPVRFDAPGGPVAVVIVKDLHTEGVHCHGTYEEEKREICIDAKTRGSFRWKTYWHEWMHVCLADSGQSETLTDAGNEAVCNAFATAMTAYQFG